MAGGYYQSRVKNLAKKKYFGHAIHDIACYLECRHHIAKGFYPEHYSKLKSYYRGAFIRNPFRRGVK